MNTLYLESFISIVESGSLAEAARRLDLTPAALAARIRALESELGVSLIRRAGRVVKPTEEGQRIHEAARQMVDQSASLIRLAQGQDSAPGPLRLGCFISASTSLLPPILKIFFRDKQAMPVFVTPGYSPELCRQVVAGELDAAIVVEHQFAIPKSCAWQTLSIDPLVVVAPRAMRGRAPHDVLTSEPFLRYDRRVWGGRLADQYLTEHGLQPRERIEIDGLMAIATMVSEGLGVTLLPDWAPMWREGLQIARLRLPNTPPVRRIGVIWNVDTPRRAGAKAMLAAAMKVFRTAK
ncbi:MAG: LysR substrate-binding domain-containing protein [Comamonas sp.]